MMRKMAFGELGVAVDVFGTGKACFSEAPTRLDC